MRGRLIFKFLAELRRLDTRAMATVDPDGPGPLTGGYDPDFTWGFVVRGFDIDEGLPVDLGRAVAEPVLETEPIAPGGAPRPSRSSTQPVA
jgi:hypothetical protein